MKKVLFTFLLAITFIGCVGVDPYNQSVKVENSMYGWNYIHPSVKYRVVQIDGHDYIVIKKDGHGGVSIIHSESCSYKH